MNTRHSSYVCPRSSLITVLVCKTDNVINFLLCTAYHRWKRIWMECMCYENSHIIPLVSQARITIRVVP